MAEIYRPDSPFYQKSQQIVAQNASLEVFKTGLDQLAQDLPISDEAATHLFTTGLWNDNPWGVGFISSVLDTCPEEIARRVEIVNTRYEVIGGMYIDIVENLRPRLKKLVPDDPDTERFFADN